MLSDGKRLLLREGAMIAVGHGATIVARLVGLRLVTGVVGPGVFGEANLLVGLVTLGTTLFCAPVLQAVLRYFAEARDLGRVHDLRRVTLRLLVPGTAVLCGVLLLGGGVWWAFMDSGPSFAAFVILAGIAIADIRRLFESNQLNAARRQGLFSFWVAADAWARPLAAVAIVALAGPSSFSVLLGFLVAAVAVNEAVVRFAPRYDEPAEPDPQWEGRLRGEIWRFVAPLIPLAVLEWTISLSDRYILAGLSGTEVTGLYIAAYGLASQPFVAVASVGVTLFRPVLFEAVAQRDLPKVRRTLAAWLATSGAIFAVGWTLLWILADEIVALLLAPEYAGSAVLLPWIGAAYAAQGMQYVFETMIYARSATKRFLPLKILGAVCSLGLYLLLIPRMGGLGAAVATFCALTLTCIFSIFLAGRPSALVAER